MQKGRNFFIAKEGFSFIFCCALFAIALLYFTHTFFFHLIAIIIFGAALYIFRTPSRIPDQYDEDAIVSPCDGYISDISTIECKGKLTGECIKVSIRVPLVASGVLRAPIKGRLMLLELEHGAQLSLAHPKSEKINEHAKLMFEATPKNRVVIKQRLNRLNPPLSFYIKEGETVDRGDRYGYMLHGKIELFLPQSCRVSVKRGEDIKAGETLLAYFS